jgi:hypothetical protein
MDACDKKAVDRDCFLRKDNFTCILDLLLGLRMNFKLLSVFSLFLSFSLLSSSYASEMLDCDCEAQRVCTSRVDESVERLSRLEEGALSKVCKRLYEKSSELSLDTDRYSKENAFNASIANWEGCTRGFMTLLCLGDPVECEGEFKDILQIKYVKACEESDVEESELEYLELRDSLYKQQWEILKSVYGEVECKKEKLSFVKEYLDDYFGD